MSKFNNVIFYKIEKKQLFVLLKHSTIIKHSSNKFYKNKTVNLINNFYADLFSLRNLEKKYWILIPLFFIFIIISFIDFYNNIGTIEKSVISEFLSATIYTITMGLYFGINMLNDKSIIKSHNKKYACNFKYLHEVRDDWLIRNWGNNYANLETIEKLENWKKYRDYYPMIYKFDWKKFTYQSDSKPRIIGLMIAFLSMSAIILINVFKPDNPQDILNQLIQNFMFILISSLFIIIFFYMIIFLISILKLIINSFFDFIFINNFSETKYRTLMGFIVNRLEVFDDKSS